MGEMRPSPTPPPADATAPVNTLTVLAAASLSGAFDALGAAFERAHPGVKYRGSYAGTQELLAQMESGAQADVFAAASEEHMGTAVLKKLVREPKAFASNRICVALAPHVPGLPGIKSLARPGLKLVVAVDKSPIGKYTRKVWAKIAADKDLGPDVAKGIEANAKSEEIDVKLVLNRVQMSEADAGFVYKSDAQQAGTKVQVMEIPDRLNVVASYPIALCATSANPDLAEQFVALVLSPEGQAILKRNGFQPPTKSGRATEPPLRSAPGAK
jgi:molybdate transport system substrate-binding protein